MKNLLSPRGILVLALVASSFVSVAAADDFQGAGNILKQIQPGSTAAKPSANAAEKLIQDILTFRKTSATLAPADAARQWIAFFDQFMTVPADQEQMAEQKLHTNGDVLMSALPGPDSWADLATQADARPVPTGNEPAIMEAGLHLLAHTLSGDPAGQRKALDAFQASPASSSVFLGIVNPSQLDDALLDEMKDPAAIAAAIRDRINSLNSGHDPKKNGVSSRFGQRQAFGLPDLVTLLGEKDATPLITDALLLPGVDVSATGALTEKLARKIALDRVADLKTPPWSLCHSLQAADLYEALDKKFSAPDKSDYYYVEARGYYLLHLIASYQTTKAISILTGNPPTESYNEESVLGLPLDEMDRAGYTEQVYDFLHDLLSAHPDLPYWSPLISLGAKTGQAAQVLDLMGKMEAKPGYTDAQLKNLREKYYLALLAADKTDEGIAELRKLIVPPQAPNVVSAIARAWGMLSPSAPVRNSSPLEKEVALARIGQLLDRKDVLDEGIADAEKTVSSSNVSPSDYSRGESVGSLAQLLTEVGRGPEAEKILTHIIAGIVASKDLMREGAGTDYLADLVRVYYLAGRPDDVLTVLQDFPGWNMRDLVENIGADTNGFSIAEFSTHAAPNNFYVAYMAAWALQQKGRTDDALKILDALLQHDNSFDPAYELLTKALGQGAIPRLDILASRDRFETRPLIWKAQLQLDAGKLDDAEKTVRAAIAIDPSDGEQGPGRRMRAYAVLADILDKKGDKEHAQTYHGAVDAIRISEHADRYYEAGLLTRAVAMYKDALTHFADAYCIQSRLALRLTELGDIKGAEEHYRRAYELMPESFGEVESHCFGCERAFAGAYPQSIAEKVFTQLAAKTPSIPQVHYLLGYLRYEQGRFSDALPEFQKAVQLDPDYLNAWKKIAELHGSMHLAPDLCNQVALAEIRLDPFQYHGEPSITGATDLAGIWNLAAANEARAPAVPGPVFALPASTDQMNSAQNSDSDSSSDIDADSTTYHAAGESISPAAVISLNGYINAAAQMMKSARQNMALFDNE